MNTKELINRLDAEPFAPFSVHVPSGYTYQVMSADQALMLGDGRTLVVPNAGDGSSEHLDIPMVERIETISNEPKGRNWWMNTNGH